MKLHALARYALLWGLLVSIGGCRSAAVLQPDFQVTTFSAGRKLTEAQVAGAIRQGGKAAGWEMVDSGPGHITGTLRVRDKHIAVTDIRYSAQEIRIAYKDSQNLNYSDGKIHRKYNSWVKRLSASIQKQLGSAS